MVNEDQKWTENEEKTTVRRKRIKVENPRHHTESPHSQEPPIKGAIRLDLRATAQSNVMVHLRNNLNLCLHHLPQARLLNCLRWAFSHRLCRD